MQNVASWIRGMRASSETPITRVDDQAAEVLFVGSTTEPGPGAALRDSERRSPSVEDGISVGDAGTSGRITDAGTGW